MNCDTSRLYGSLDDAILYLTEIKAAHTGVAISLDEHWYGYEDMMMQFVYQRLETDEELQSRLRDIAAKKKAEQEAAAAENVRKVKLNEYQRLKRELGV